MKLLIGGKALAHFGQEYLYPGRKPSLDTDWICSYDEYEHIVADRNERYVMIPLNRGKSIAYKSKTAIIEFEIAWEDSLAAELIELVQEHDLAVEKDGYLIAKPEVIFALKKSHRYLKDSPHFLKTMLDYKHLRDKCGCKVPEALQDWYKRREEDTYWYAHPNLKVSKDEFFKDDAVPYEFDHDTIHLSVAHLDRPAYEYFKDDQAEVFCSKKKFWECDELTRLYAVLEESYVLALERSQIPTRGGCSRKKSFGMALMKVCSSITSGWFRAYAYENYFEVLKLYNDDYVDRFWKGVETGLVRKLTENELQNISKAG